MTCELFLAPTSHMALFSLKPIPVDVTSFPLSPYKYLSTPPIFTPEHHTLLSSLSLSQPSKTIFKASKQANTSLQSTSPKTQRTWQSARSQTSFLKQQLSSRFWKDAQVLGRKMVTTMKVVFLKMCQRGILLCMLVKTEADTLSQFHGWAIQSFKLCSKGQRRSLGLTMTWAWLFLAKKTFFALWCIKYIDFIDWSWRKEGLLFLVSATNICKKDEANLLGWLPASFILRRPWLICIIIGGSDLDLLTFFIDYCILMHMIM